MNSKMELCYPKYIICVCGSIRDGLPTTSGQTIKTRNLISELNNQYGSEKIYKVDTQKEMFLVLFSLLIGISFSKNVVVLPAQNGVKILVPFLYFINLFYNRSIQYSVIGAWLPTFLTKKPLLRSILKKYDKIYVETNTLYEGLQQLGFRNVVIMPNFKRIDIADAESIKGQYQVPYKLCTFSRVMKEKGIEDAVNVVIEINKEYGETVFTLDIYGKIENGQEIWFEELKKKFVSSIKYKGIVDSDKSTFVIKDYFCLLFPTLFFTEGIPGTIIDAYASGVPVIASKWQSFGDVVEEGVSGYGYSFGETKSLKQLLIRIKNHPEMITSLKTNCLKMAKRYTPEEAMAKLVIE